MRDPYAIECHANATLAQIARRSHSPETKTQWVPAVAEDIRLLVELVKIERARRANSIAEREGRHANRSTT